MTAAVFTGIVLAEAETGEVADPSAGRALDGVMSEELVPACWRKADSTAVMSVTRFGMPGNSQSTTSKLQLQCCSNCHVTLDVPTAKQLVQHGSDTRVCTKK